MPPLAQRGGAVHEAYTAKTCVSFMVTPSFWVPQGREPYGALTVYRCLELLPELSTFSRSFEGRDENRCSCSPERLTLSHKSLLGHRTVSIQSLPAGSTLPQAIQGITMCFSASSVRPFLERFDVARSVLFLRGALFSRVSNHYEVDTHRLELFFFMRICRGVTITRE